MLRLLSILITFGVFLPGLVLSQENEIDLKKFETATGECSVSEKEAINKKAIKEAIEKLFKVNVIKVNIINQKSKLKIKQGKKSIKSGYKKAIITLKKGQSIDLTTGI